MVTLQEARSEINRARQELEMQKELVGAEELKVRSAQLPSVPRRQLQFRGILELAKRKLQGVTLGKQKEEAMGVLSGVGQQLKEREEAISQYESQVAPIERNVRQWEEGYQTALRGAAPINLDKTAMKGYLAGRGELAGYETRKTTIGTLKEAGITLPQWTDITKSKDFAADISKLSGSQINVLEKGGLITVQQPTAVAAPPPVIREGGIVSEPKPIITQREADVPMLFKRLSDVGQKVTGFFKKDVAPVIVKSVGWATEDVPKFVAAIPFPKFYTEKEKITAKSLIPFPLRGKKEWSTLGEESLKFREGLGYSGKIISSGWERIIGKERLTKEVPSRDIPFFRTETMIGTPTREGVTYAPPTKFTIEGGTQTTALGWIPKIAGALPQAAGYIAAPTVMLTADVAGAGQKMRDIEKRVDKEIESQYKAYVNENILTVQEGYRLPTKEEFIDAQRGILKEQLMRQYKIEAGLAEAFLVGMGATKLYKELTKPIVRVKTYEPISRLREVTGKRPIKMGTEEYLVPETRFEIITKRKAPQVRVTSRFRETFGMKPKIDWTPVGKTSYYSTGPFLGKPVYGKQPYLSQTIKISTRPTVPKLTLIEPKGSGMLTPEQIMKLPKAEKYVFMKTGVKRINQRLAVVKRGEDVFLYDISKSKLSGATLKATKWVSKPGKSTELFFLSNAAEPIRSAKDQTIYNILTGFKSTTKPFYRAAGKIKILPGNLLDVGRLPAIEIGGIGKGYPSVFVKAGEGFGKGYPSVFVKAGEGFGKGYPSVSVKAGKGFGLGIKPKVTEEILKTISKQEMIGALPKVIPSFVPKTVSKAVTKQLAATLAPRVYTSIKTAAALESLIKPKVSLTQGLIPLEKVKQIPDIVVVPEIITAVGVKTKVVSTLAVAPVVIPKVVEIIIPKTITPSIISIPTRPRTPEFKIPKVPPIIPIPTPSAILGVRKRRVFDLFVPEVRRKGKFAPVSKPTSFIGALTIGKRKVVETLGASLRIKKAKTGEVVPLTPFGIFRPSKKEAGVLIQVRQARLGTRGEKKEIQAARRAATWWK